MLNKLIHNIKLFLLKKKYNKKKKKILEYTNDKIKAFNSCHLINWSENKKN